MLLITSKGGAGNAVATVVVAEWENAVDWNTLRVELDRGYVAALVDVGEAQVL